MVNKRVTLTHEFKPSEIKSLELESGKLEVTMSEITINVPVPGKIKIDSSKLINVFDGEIPESENIKIEPAKED